MKILDSDGAGYDAAAVREFLWRSLLLGAVLLQAALFGAAAYINRHGWLYSDNFLYESPAWNLASGHGFTLARSEWEDPYVTGLFRAAHPEMAASRYVPATVMPPGYGYFLAGIYCAVGRSQLAAILANGVLLLGTIAAFATLVRRAYGRGLEAKVAMVLIAAYPMWAFWAARIVSETLHTFLITMFAVVWLVDRPSPLRTGAAGVLLGLASLTRPYAVLLPLAFAVAHAVTRVRTFSPRNLALLAMVTWSVFGTWTVRNYYYLRKPVPVTTMTSGFALWLATYDHAHTVEERKRERESLGLEDGDLYRFHEGARLQAFAMRRIWGNPGRYFWACLTRLPRRWVPMDGSGTLPGPASFVLTASHVLLLTAMLGGMWFLRRTRDTVLAGCFVMVIYYTLVFSPLHVEARYMLPARAFGLILSAPPLALIIRRSGRFLSSGRRRVESQPSAA